MTTGLPASGQISIGNVSVEILRSATATTTLNDTDVRTLFGQATGSVDLNTGHGKRWVVANSQTFSSSGTFSVPRYATITVQLWGGGGGSGGGGGNDSWAYGYNGGAGTAGGTTSFASGTAMNAYGGGAGGPGYNGGAGTEDGPYTTKTDGGGASGGAGVPGNNGYASGGAGGAGGYISKTWAYNDAGAPAWFSNITVTIGGGGSGGGAGENAPGGNGGGNGQAVITWS
jgi:hypothetical protein